MICLLVCLKIAGATARRVARGSAAENASGFQGSERLSPSDQAETSPALGELIELALRKPAVADDGAEVLLDLAHDIDRGPQPLAGIAVAHRGGAPILDIA